MSTTNRGPAARVLRNLPLLLTLLGAGCGRLSPGGFHGHRVVPVRDVSTITLPALELAGPAHPYTFRAAPGGLVLAYFGYASCPDVCPATLAGVREALELLGPDAARVKVAFVTVDPRRDSASVLLPYVRTFFADGIALRPADQGALGRAERAFGSASTVVRRPDGEVRVSHTPYLYVVDEHGRMGVEWAFGIPPAKLAADLRFLLRTRGVP
jgi:protein SCO1